MQASTGSVSRFDARQEPTVSIIIPCHNYGRFLAEALESALGQTRPPDEVIVVDDGSTDGSADVARRYARHPALTVIAQPQQGAIATYNAGVRASAGQFFLILSADDRLDPRYLERTIPLLAADPRAGYVYTAYRMFGVRQRMRAAPPFNARLLARRPYITATALMRRAAFDEAGGFSQAMEGGHEDWEFFVTLAERGWHGVALPEILFHYRKHSSSSRNALSFRRWVEVRARVYAGHRRLYRIPRRPFLALVVLDQQWLRLKAAPRALLRRLGREGAPAGARAPVAPRICLVARERVARRDLHAAMLADRLGAARLECADAEPATGGAGRGSVARLARQLLGRPADLYHAYDPPSLLAALPAAMRHRALLLYDRERCPGRSGRLVERLIRWRLDALTCAAGACAAPLQRRLGVPPVVLVDDQAQREIEGSRLVRLYRDLVGAT